ncbi:MAG: hypothetical protein AB7Q17_04215 [Phycisphaerae bacterium]
MAAAFAFVASTWAQIPELRLFFSAEDPLTPIGRETPSLPGNVDGSPGNALPTPPVTNPVIEFGRLWIWGTGNLGNPDPHEWRELSFNVLVNGPATIVGGGMLNITSPSIYRRWETGSDFTPPTFDLISVTRVGLRLPPANDGWDDGRSMVLLGYMDFAANAGASAVRFQVGNHGFDCQCHPWWTYRIYFGVGDDWLDESAFGQTTPIPEAWIGVPEPGGWPGLALCAYAACRRLRR